MELILINESKLKVMLTSEDMKYYELDNERLDYDNIETRSAFRTILKEAKFKTGFDTEKDRIFIQVYPSRSGGCEMYVTKLGISKKDEDSLLYQKNGQKQQRATKSSIYKFGSAEMLITACKYLMKCEYIKSSKAYCDVEKNEYYLTLLVYAYEKNSVTALLYLNELGKEIKESLFHFYIFEHCKEICKNDAIKVLSRL